MYVVNRSRELNRKRAAELMRLDKPNEARTFLRRCIDVTHNMALTLMRECRARNIDCITAPYEADAQLAYLSITNIAHIVITEDSDLVVFGCSKVIKMISRCSKWPSKTLNQSCYFFVLNWKYDRLNFI